MHIMAWTGVHGFRESFVGILEINCLIDQWEQLYEKVWKQHIMAWTGLHGFRESFVGILEINCLIDQWKQLYEKERKQLLESGLEKFSAQKRHLFKA